jgi:hypothetical protein
VSVCVCVCVCVCIRLCLGEGKADAWRLIRDSVTEVGTERNRAIAVESGKETHLLEGERVLIKKLVGHCYTEPRLCCKFRCNTPR